MKNETLFIFASVVIAAVIALFVGVMPTKHEDGCYRPRGGCSENAEIYPIGRPR